MPERFVPIDSAPAKIKIEIKLAISAYSMTVAPPVSRANDFNTRISATRSGCTKIVTFMRVTTYLWYGCNETYIP